MAFGFGKREVTGDARLAQLENELVKLGSAVRQLQLEQEHMHDQVRRWMRRAVAAERRAESGPAERAGAPGAVSGGTPVRMTPARLRAMSQGRIWGGHVETARTTLEDAPGSTNGVDHDPEQGG